MRKTSSNFQVGVDVLSESGVLNSSKRKRRENLFGIPTDDDQNMDRSLIEFQGYQDDSRILEKVIAEIPNSNERASS